MSDRFESDLAAERKLVGLARRDLDALGRALLPWLHRQLPNAETITLPVPSVPTAGGSSETFFIEPLICEGGTERRECLVLRVEATRHRVYELPSIDRQFGAIAALAGIAPVPRTCWLERDPEVLGAPFFVMERVAGAVPADRYHSSGLFLEAAPATRERMWASAVSAIAAINLADIEGFAFLERPEFGSTPLEQEMAVWDSYRRWIDLPPKPAQERAHRWLHDNLPTDIPKALSWGDARVPNMIFRDGICRAVLDWETVSLAGAELDLGWMLFFDWFVSAGHGIPRLSGIPGRDATIEMWADRIGRAPNSLAWCELFATWRFSLIKDHALRLAGVDRMPGVPGPDPLLGRLEALM